MIDYSSALEDYRRARRQALLKEILVRFTGGSNQLLSFDEVRQFIKLQNSSEIGLMEIPIESIIGSVNRYADFTRDFLPKENITPDRWVRVEMAVIDQAGLPPIDVYKVGDVYFVKDGNHRVAVARQIGVKTIQAYVTEIKTPVPLTTDTRFEDLIIKAEYASFLEKTHLPESRPEADLSLTIAGQYPKLEDHIAVHRYFMGLEQKRDITYEEAAVHWFDTVYQPAVQMIMEKGILRDFPDRTEGDLYLWLADYRAELENELGIEIKSSDAMADLVEQFSPRPEKVAARLGAKFLNTILPNSLEGGPPIGKWRREKLTNQQDNAPVEGYLFSDILVPVSGRENGWNALDQAILIAKLENSRLFGLHVLPPFLKEDSQAAQEIKTEFTHRCQVSSITNSFVFASGEVSQNIYERARWVDLVVVNQDYPLSTQPLATLQHGLRNLIQQCPRPVMTVKQTVSPLRKILLAYDDSPKSREALFVATYLSGKWEVPLVVASVLENGRVNASVLEEAHHYLESHGLQADLILREGPTEQALLQTAGAYGSELLIMGGYSHGPLLDTVLGKTVNRILNEFEMPIIICR
jgi:nucleotide-binding universal stress UspA family protein